MIQEIKTTLYLARKTGLKYYFFIMPLVFSILISIFEALSIGLLIPTINGLLRQDYSFIRGNAYFKPIINIFPELFKHNKSIFLTLILTIFFSIIIKNILTYISNYIKTKYYIRLNKNLRNILFKKCINSTKTFFDTHNQGYIHKIILNQSIVMKNALNNIQELIHHIIMVIAYILIIIFISWRLALFIIIISPILAFTIKSLIKNIKKSSKSLNETKNNISRNLSNILSCILLIKTNNSEINEIKNFKNMSTTLENYNLNIEKKRILIGPLQEIISTIGILLIVSFIAYLIINQKAGDLISLGIVFLIARRNLGHITTINNIKSTFASKHAELEELKIFLNYNDKKIIQGNIEFKELKDKIEFKKLNFSYNNKREILKNISFEIKKDKMTAIVGNTGSGKTTIINLILRLYNCPKKSIFIDGIDISDYTIESLMKHISFVSQDSMLFNDTIKNNLIYGIKRKITKEEINQVLDKTYLSDFISRLPDGINTEIGDRGVKLSGGEKQRLAIARALLKNTNILILDEATSSLDSITEKHIKKSIEEATKQKTSIVIAHRLSTIKHADKIIVIKKGEIVEQGKIQELINNKGYFYELWQHQKFD